MAQVHKRHVWGERLARYFSQRPLVLVGCLGVVVALMASGLFGMSRARAYDGFVIESDARGAVDDEGSRDADVEPRDAGDGTRGDKDSNRDTSSADAPEIVVVDVAGAVRRPCVVELPRDARVRDAIDAAGGLSDDAEVSAVNRAAPLVDGQQIYVPRKGELAPATGQSVQAGGAGSASNGIVNINTASAEELDELPGVGPSTAQAIVDERAQNGPFASVEDIMRVSGIGEKKFEKLKGSICV